MFKGKFPLIQEVRVKAVLGSGGLKYHTQDLGLVSFTVGDVQTNGTCLC